MSAASFAPTTAAGAVYNVLGHGGPMTAREVTSQLVREHYRWPRASWPHPCYERVYATLRGLESRALVHRERRGREWVWMVVEEIEVAP